MVKLEKLIASFASDRATSPVMDWAFVLAARQGPCSCAAADSEQASTDPITALSNLSRFMS
jgi:hypothetical protein